MPGSPNKTVSSRRLTLSAWAGHLFVSVVLAGAVIPAGIANAQQSNPVRLQPKSLTPAPAEPSNAETDTRAATGTPGIGYKQGPRGQSLTTLRAVGAKGIEVDRLQVVTPDSAGALTPESGGLGRDMWRGTSLASAEKLFSGLPSRLGSPVMAGLVRRFALSVAEPPEGNSNGEQLAVQRIERLIAMADYASALELLSIMPRQGRGAGLMRAEAELKFLAGDHVGGCAMVGDEVRRSPSDFWQKALVFCQLLSGQQDKAELGISMLREVGASDDGFFDMANAMAQGLPYEISNPDSGDFLSLIMLSRMNVIVMPDIVRQLSPGAVLALSVNPNLPATTRLVAFEQAAQMQLLSGSRMKKLFQDIYSQLPPPADSHGVSEKPETISTSVSGTTSDAPPPQAGTENPGGNQSADPYVRNIERARLLMASFGTTVPAAKAEAVSGALISASADNVLAAWAGLFRDELAAIPIASDYAWLAPHAFRATLANGEHEQAEAWLVILRRAALRGEEHRVALAGVQVLAELVNPRNEIDPAISGAQETIDKPLIFRAITSGLGKTQDIEIETALANDDDTSEAAVSVSPALWLALLELNKSQDSGSNQSDFSPALVAGLQPAEIDRVSAPVVSTVVAVQQLDAPTAGARSDIKNKAAHVLLMARIIGSANPGNIHPVLLREVISGLNGLGFKDEAYTLGVEAMLGAGY